MSAKRQQMEFANQDVIPRDTQGAQFQSSLTPGVSKMSMMNTSETESTGRPRKKRSSADCKMDTDMGNVKRVPGKVYSSTTQNKRVFAPCPSQHQAMSMSLHTEDEAILQCEESLSDFGTFNSSPDKSVDSEEDKEVFDLGSETVRGRGGRGVNDPKRQRHNHAQPEVQLIAPLHTIQTDAECSFEILQYMTLREKAYQPRSDYMQIISHLEPSMRSILYDWMMEVSQEFSLGRESMHLAVNYVDRILSKCTLRYESQASPDEELHTKFIHRGNLQLLGVTCLFIASKLEEIYPPNCPDFANTTADTYNVCQIEEMERVVLRNLDWQLHGQTLCSWLKIYLKLASIYIQRTFPDSPERHATIIKILSVDTFTHLMELLDMTIIDISFIRFYPSAIAASAICLHLVELRSLVDKFTNYSISELTPCVSLLAHYEKIPHRGIKPPSKPYFDLKINPEDMYTCQFHHPGILEYARSVSNQVKQHLDTLPHASSLSPVDGAFVELERQKKAKRYGISNFQFQNLPQNPNAPTPTSNHHQLHSQAQLQQQQQVQHPHNAHVQHNRLAQHQITAQQNNIGMPPFGQAPF